MKQVRPSAIYRWKAKYGGMIKEEARKFCQLEAERERLKKLVADLSLDNTTLKEVDMHKQHYARIMQKVALTAA